MLTSLGPFGYALMGIAALVVGIVAVANFVDGNTEMGIAQVINLVTIVFSMFNPTCFTGDTPVYTDEGLVCIEEISVGDKVLAYDYETGATELKEVLNVWIKETDEILHVSTSDDETIDTTTNHPFYVDGKGWVAAGDLEIGDVLVTANGDEVEVSDIEIEKLAESIIVYNLEVEDCHTYFVGEYGVLVHNSYDYDDAFPELPVRDKSGKVHTYDGAFGGVDGLPTPAELKKYPSDVLEYFHGELAESVKKRIEKNIKNGYHRNHGQRQAFEQQLMKAIEKILNG